MAEQEMKSFTERATAIAPRMKLDKQKGAAFDEVVPVMLSEQTVLVADDAPALHQMVSKAAPAIALLDAKVFVEGLVTHPGDVVVNENSSQRYLYVGKEKMIHSNPTYYPGAPGVYYWNIVPSMKSGSKVFPNVDGQVIAVQPGEKWWNPTEDTLYEWAGEAYDCPTNFYPGAAGVHQWVKVE